MESIENIRKNAIVGIKEKVKKNPKYLHPVNKERLEDMKKFMFVSGNEFTQWMQQNGIMKNPTNIRHNRVIEEYKDQAKIDGFDDVLKWNRWKKEQNWYDALTEKYGKEFTDWVRKNKDEVPDKWTNAGCKTRSEYNNWCAQKKGFKDNAEEYREWRHKTGRSGILIELNDNCPSWFGEYTENLMINRYPGALKMPPQNPGFDYLWNGIEIENKGRCLTYWPGRSTYWQYEIGYNQKAKKFTLSGWDNRNSLTPMCAWEFDKNDLVRKGKGYCAPKVEFWKRYSFVIMNTPEGLKQFEKYQIDIDWLKELCNKDGDK